MMTTTQRPEVPDIQSLKKAGARLVALCESDEGLTAAAREISASVPQPEHRGELLANAMRQAEVRCDLARVLKQIDALTPKPPIVAVVGVAAAGTSSGEKSSAP